MKFKIDIYTDNDAFGDCPTERNAELARILEKTAKELLLYDGEFKWLHDSNGNKVGSMEFLK